MARTFEIEEASITDIVRAIASGRVTSEQVTSAHLARIEAYDKAGPSINAIISINERAIDDARTLDARFRSTGVVGPLHGVPLIVKDNFDFAGMATTAGSRVLRHHRPAHDAFVVRKARAAGAIILAKANLHEFALGGTTTSALGGQTLNPYDLSRTPGGSSGGTAAAIAASFCVAGLGSDTVNSIRSPASATNIVGLRPTRGLLSRGGVVPVSHTQDAVGPLARRVHDAAILLDVLAGYDPLDAATAWSVGRAQGGYAARLRPALDGVRVGVCPSLFGSGVEHAEVSRIVSGALTRMETAGARLVEMKTLRLDVPALVQDADVQRFEFQPAMNRYLSRAARDGIRSLQAVLRSEEAATAVPGAFLRDADAVEMRVHAAEYHRRIARIAAFRETLADAMARYRVDVIAYPLQRRLVVPVGSTEQPDRNGIVAALAGFPAIDVPAGFSSPSIGAPAGVPVGLDLLGMPWSEQRLLDVALAWESIAGLRKAPAATPPR